MADLVCPKCQSAMRSYERNGVTIDQCTGCRGVFLDRGELERIVDAEGSFYEQREREAPRYEQPRYEQPRYDQRQQHYGHKHHKHHKRHKRESFLGELFDMG